MQRVLYLFVMLVGFAQTRVNEQQINYNIRVVERYVCSQPPAAVDCSFLGLYRFQMADGTTVGPFYVIPAPGDFVMDGRWVRQ